MINLGFWVGSGLFPMVATPQFLTIYLFFPPPISHTYPIYNSTLPLQSKLSDYSFLSQVIQWVVLYAFTLLWRLPCATCRATLKACYNQSMCSWHQIWSQTLTGQSTTVQCWAGPGRGFGMLWAYLGPSTILAVHLGGVLWLLTFCQEFSVTKSTYLVSLFVAVSITLYNMASCLQIA